MTNSMGVILLILCSNFFFLVLTKYVLNQFHSKYLRNQDTLQVSTVVGLDFTQSSRHVLHSVWQVEGCDTSP